MSNIQALISSEMHFEFSSQYAPIDEKINSIICFINYYDQVFKGSNTDVCLHLVFLDRNGNESGYKKIDVSANDAVQFKPKLEGICSDGRVLVAAIPKRNIHEINHRHLNIRNKVGSGFYIKWENESGGKDLMHEWSALQTKVHSRAVHHIGLSKTLVEIEYGAILMNPIAVSGAFSQPILKLRVSGRSDIIETVSLDTIPPLGTRMVRFSHIFKHFDTYLTKERSLVVDVISENLSPPLTAEWNSTGDFHFHHI